jgi:hypothetical protein
LTNYNNDDLHFSSNGCYQLAKKFKATGIPDKRWSNWREYATSAADSRQANAAAGNWMPNPVLTTATGGNLNGTWVGGGAVPSQFCVDPGGTTGVDYNGPANTATVVARADGVGNNQRLLFAALTTNGSVAMRNAFGPDSFGTGALSAGWYRAAVQVVLSASTAVESVNAQFGWGEQSGTRFPAFPLLADSTTQTSPHPGTIDETLYFHTVPIRYDLETAVSANTTSITYGLGFTGAGSAISEIGRFTLIPSQPII